MKKSLYLFLGILLICGIYQACVPDVELPGSIYGVVADKATGEPIKSAGVELSPGGLKTITGSEGQFEFTELDPGKYTLLITKTGYLDGVSSTIEVKPGQQAKGDVQMEQIPPALKVVDENNADLLELHFGDAEADIARSFNIYNDGAEKLSWEIVKTAVWIDSISKTSGDVSPNGKQPIVVTIDRNKLEEGENKTTLQITSSNGSKSLTVIAVNSRKAVSLNTLECTDVKGTIAIFNAELLCEGNPKYTERGFVYSTTQQPTVDNTIAKLTVPVNEKLQFSAQAVDLAANTTYYVRAYAISVLGTFYSTNQVSFVVQTSAPTVVTDSIKDLNIENGTAIFNGKVTYVGDPAYTERGFVYALTNNPTIDDTKLIVSGAELGIFRKNVSGLEEGKTYYVRAYVTNKKGTVYGNEVSCDFTATMPEVKTLEVTNKNIADGIAAFKGNVVSEGDLGYTERGFVYATVHNPTLSDSKVIAEGNGTGDFTATATGLIEGKVYYIRAFVTNSKGTIYGNELEMDFNAIMPVVSTQEVTGKIIAQGIATLHGTIESKGDPAYTQRGFVYGVAHNPTKDDATVINVSGTNTGTYTYNLNNLEMGSVYYVRAFATSSKGTAYGDEVALDFNAIMPEVTTISATVQDAEHIYLIGNIVAVGDPEYIERGFIYGTMSTPMIDDANVTKVSVAKTSSVQYEKQVTINGVGSNSLYIRAYAKSEAGIVYGNILEITPETFAYMALPTFIHDNATYRVHPEFDFVMTWYEANALCSSLTYGGFSDWFVPEKSQLVTMYLKRMEITGFYLTASYWSCSKGGAMDAYVVDFSDGDQWTVSYYDDERVRCVRREN